MSVDTHHLTGYGVEHYGWEIYKWGGDRGDELYVWALASRSRSGSSYLTGGQAGEISAEAARAHFDEVLEALSAEGIDTSEIHFNEGYGLLYAETEEPVP